jgi:hypothetical protein
VADWWSPFPPHPDLGPRRLSGPPPFERLARRFPEPIRGEWIARWRQSWARPQFPRSMCSRDVIIVDRGEVVRVVLSKLEPHPRYASVWAIRWSTTWATGHRAKTRGIVWDFPVDLSHDDRVSIERTRVNRRRRKAP